MRAVATSTVGSVLIIIAVLVIALLLLGNKRGSESKTERYVKTSDQRANYLASVPDWLSAAAKRVRNPYKGCQELYPDLDESDPYEENYKQEIKLHNETYWRQPSVLSAYKGTGREPDGYSFRGATAQVILQQDLSRLQWVKTVCEVGFNGGHSALTWLVANPGINLYSFDIGGHPYCKAMGDYLAERFPGRFTLILGDSGKTLPIFIRKNPNVKCDIMSVDGGHFYKYAIQDLSNFRRMSTSKNLVLFDDYPHGDVLLRKQDLGRAWEEFIEKEHITEIFRCAFVKDPRKTWMGEKGISLGHFNLWH